MQKGIAAVMAKHSNQWFKVYLDKESTIDSIPDHAAGQALKACFRYWNTGEIPELDEIAKIAFITLKDGVDESIENIQKSVENGKKGAEKRWNKEHTENDSPPIAPYSFPIGDYREKEIELDSDIKSDTEINSDTDIIWQSVTKDWEKKNNKQQKTYAEDETAWKAANWLSRKLNKEYPTIKLATPETIQSWASVFDTMENEDGHSAEEILALMRFAFQDNFWKDKISTPWDVRKHYIKILAKATKEGWFK